MAKRMEPDAEWFEVADTDWLDPRFKPKMLKLVADAQIPRGVVQEIVAAQIRVESLDAGEMRASDSEVLRRAHGSRRVLLTLDRDFWDDRKYPLHTLRGGIIYVAEPPESPGRILRAFGLVYGCFAKSYPLDWWEHMKIKANIGEFEIKMRSWEGKVVRYKMKLRGGYLVAKEITDV